MAKKNSIWWIKDYFFISAIDFKVFKRKCGKADSDFNYK